MHNKTRSIPRQSSDTSPDSFQTIEKTVIVVVVVVATTFSTATTTLHHDVETETRHGRDVTAVDVVEQAVLWQWQSFERTTRTTL